MSKKLPYLTETNGLFSGEHSVEFYTLAQPTTTTRAFSQFFPNVQFFGPGYQSGDNMLSTVRRAHDMTENATDWTSFLQVEDPEDPELVIGAIEVMRRNGRPDIDLFRFELSYSLHQVNTKVDDYGEVRRWHAMQKLNDADILLLGLEKDYIYLKLKYQNEKKS